MSSSNFGGIDDSQLVDMFGRIDFGAPDFDRTVLNGDDLGGIFGSLDCGFTDDQILDALGVMEANDFGTWDPSVAFNVFDNIAFGEVSGFNNLASLVGAMGPDEFGNLEDGKLVDLIRSFGFGGPDFDLGIWAGGASFDVFSTIGLDQALGLDQLEGIVGNFGPEQIQQLGGDLGSLLGGLDFQGNGEVLQNFSFDA